MQPSTGTTRKPVDAIIMAAGKGTRMGSDLAKVLHPVADRAMVHWVVDACEAAGVRRCIIIVGHQADAVREELSGRPGCQFVEQTQQLGTGHAVMQAERLFAGESADVFVLCGDGPLIRTSTLETLLQTHRQAGASATLATAVLEDGRGYGRILRDKQGRLQAIVEEKDATEAQRAIQEVNPSYYCFDSTALFAALKQVGNANAKGEYYLTDVLEIMQRAGKKVAAVEAVPANDVLAINTPEQLVEVDGILRQRLETGAHAP